MNQGAFWNSVKDCVKLLKDLGFYKAQNLHQNSLYSAESKDYSRCEDYLKIYDSMANCLDYDILLKDDSMIQLNLLDGKLRFLFIQNPVKYISVEDYVIEYHSEDINEDFTLEILCNIYQSEYEQYIETQDVNKTAVYMRYDEDDKDYMPMIHSYTHLHVGIGNKIRIPFKKKITPVSFLLFVFQQVYYDRWVKEFRKVPQDNVILPYIKQKQYCEELIPTQWTTDEEELFYVC